MVNHPVETAYLATSSQEMSKFTRQRLFDEGRRQVRAWEKANVK